MIALRFAAWLFLSIKALAAMPLLAALLLIVVIGAAILRTD